MIIKYEEDEERISLNILKMNSLKLQQLKGIRRRSKNITKLTLYLHLLYNKGIKCKILTNNRNLIQIKYLSPSS